MVRVRIYSSCLENSDFLKIRNIKNMWWDLLYILCIMLYCNIYAQLKNSALTAACFFFITGYWGWKSGRNGGRNPAEKAQTQKTSGQRCLRQRRWRLQGQEATWTSPGWETVPEPPEAHQTNEHHHRYGHQLQRRVRKMADAVTLPDVNRTSCLATPPADWLQKSFSLFTSVRLIK